MRTTVLAAFLVLAFGSLYANAGECVTERSDLLKLINDVSIATGRKFVIDPRVQAGVILAGFKDGEVDYPTLLSVLEVYAFTALEANGIVYVVPVKVAPEMKLKLGIE